MKRGDEILYDVKRRVEEHFFSYSRRYRL